MHISFYILKSQRKYNRKMEEFSKAIGTKNTFATICHFEMDIDVKELANMVVVIEFDEFSIWMDVQTILK